MMPATQQPQAAGITSQMRCAYPEGLAQQVRFVPAARLYTAYVQMQAAPTATHATHPAGLPLAQTESAEGQAMGPAMEIMHQIQPLLLQPPPASALKLLSALQIPAGIATQSLTATLPRTAPAARDATSQTLFAEFAILPT